MNYAIVNEENKVIQLLNYGRVVTDLRTYSAKALAGLSQAQKDELCLHDVVTDPQPEYDKETQKLVFVPLSDGDVFANQSWEIVELTDEEHNAIIENTLAQMDSQDMQRSVEDAYSANKAAFATLGVNYDDFIDQYFLDKKAAKEAERAKIKK